MSSSYLRRLPAGFWIGLAVGAAIVGWLDWYFGRGPGAGTDAGEVHGYALMIAGFPLIWLGGLLAEAIPSAAVIRVSVMALVVLNVAAWGAGIHVTFRSLARRVRELHARPR